MTCQMIWYLISKWYQQYGYDINNERRTKKNVKETDCLQVAPFCPGGDELNFHFIKTASYLTVVCQQWKILGGCFGEEHVTILEILSMQYIEMHRWFYYETNNCKYRHRKTQFRYLSIKSLPHPTSIPPNMHTICVSGLPFHIGRCHPYPSCVTDNRTIVPKPLNQMSVKCHGLCTGFCLSWLVLT